MAKKTQEELQNENALIQNEMVKLLGNEELDQYTHILDSTETLTDIEAVKNVNVVRFAYYFLQGFNVKQISEIMGIDYKTAKKVRASEEFKTVLNGISAEVVSTARAFLTAAGFKAVRTLIDAMNSYNEKVRLKAAIEVLDRIGLKTPEKFEVVTKQDDMSSMSSDELLKLVKQGIDEIAQLNGGKEEADANE